MRPLKRSRRQKRGEWFRCQRSFSQQPFCNSLPSDFLSSDMKSFNYCPRLNWLPAENKCPDFPLLQAVRLLGLSKSETEKNRLQWQWSSDFNKLDMMIVTMYLWTVRSHEQKVKSLLLLRGTLLTFTFRAFGRCLYPKRLRVIHPYTDGGGCHAGCRPAHQEQFGVQFLAQRHFDMQTRGIKPATFQYQDASSVPEPHSLKLSWEPLKIKTVLSLLRMLKHSLKLWSLTWPPSGLKLHHRPPNHLLLQSVHKYAMWTW